jgi:hypothetical protein
MRGRFLEKVRVGRRVGWLAVTDVLAVVLLMGTQVANAAHGEKAGTGVCRRGVLEGEVRAGENFARPIGGGLEARLESLSWGSGWALRIVPINGMPKGLPAGIFDYAQLATPPYSAVNPRLLSTDYSFRAQDAVAWNPRRFRYAAGAAEFSRLVAAYERYIRVLPPTPESENELAAMVSKEPEGTLEILDARLIPGTANQAGTAALVASHFSTTAHTVEEPQDGKGSPLGKLTWLRFRIGLNLPRGFVPEKGIKVNQVGCD